MMNTVLTILLVLLVVTLYTYTVTADELTEQKCTSHQEEILNNCIIMHTAKNTTEDNLYNCEFLQKVYMCAPKCVCDSHEPSTAAINLHEAWHTLECSNKEGEKETEDNHPICGGAAKNYAQNIIMLAPLMLFTKILF